MFENQVSTGLSQFTAGANGLVTSGNIIGAPATYATAANVYAPGCVLYQRDSTTGYMPTAWQNTGTAAVPVWAALANSKVLSATALGTPYQLLASQSGATVLFDKVDGAVFTLPAPAVGMEFSFYATATVTSNSYKVITNTGTVLLAGSILGSVDNTANKSWVGNGTSHVAVTQAAASTNATGGILGSWVRFRCTTALQWNVIGMTIAGGTPSTPFAAS